MEDWIERLLKFIDIEYDSANDATDNLWAMPIEEQVSKGEALSNLRATFAADNRSVMFTTEQNISKFREGARVVVRGHGIRFKGDIEKEEGVSLKVVMNAYDGYPTVPIQLRTSGGWEIVKDKVDIRHIVKTPIIQLALHPGKHELIKSIISGELRPEFDNELYERAVEMVPDSLNFSQKEAFLKAFSATNYYLIQGPPGTGKTWVLAHLAVAFAKEGKNVLVTAFTHTGINNALRKIKEVTGYTMVAKLGKKYQSEHLSDEDVTVSNGENLASNGLNMQSRGVILGATAYAPNTNKLRGFHFDVVIFDEASQMTVPLAVAAMAAGTKFIFIGDHKQLAPIISDKQTDTDFSKSIFEYLFQFSPGSMLQSTYRMNKEINLLPSLLFYEGRLATDKSASDRRIRFSSPPSEFEDILDADSPDVFVKLRHRGITTHCQEEASLIADLVAVSLQSGIPSKEIAVVTPYRAQVRLIQSALAEKLARLGIGGKKIFIDTVERIQGQERDLVIYSLTTSDKKLMLDKASFFLQPQRLNVALTRARKKRIFIGSDILWELHSDQEEIQNWIEAFHCYLKSATVITVDKENTEDLF